MITFLDALDAFIKKYKQPYTIYDWVKQMHPENQGFSSPRPIEFKNGFVFFDNENTLGIESIVLKSFLWEDFDKKFFHKSKNYILVGDVYKYIQRDFKIKKVNYFYNPNKMIIKDFNIFHLRKNKYILNLKQLKI